MITPRGWSLLAVLGFMLATGVLRGQSTLAVIALAILLWFLGEWFLFTLRVRLTARRLRVIRQLSNERGPVATLWAGQTFHVHVELSLSGSMPLSYVAVSDRLPFGVDHVSGPTACDGRLNAGEALSLYYRIHCPTVGRVRFEGLRVRLGDLQGLFYHATFVPGVVQLRVLPALADEAGQPVSRKRHNLLPPPGIHRLHRPGSGSELLDLRDYLPGDPPKTIAWKVSARRDRLITKEFESEVPVRCTLFLDTSHSVRVGPPGKNAAARLVNIAAAIAQANTSNRDLTGLCTIDEKQTHWTRPARTQRHLAELTRQLTDVAGLAPSAGEARVEELLPLAYSFAQEVYPYLLLPDLNHVPAWLPWLSPVPAFADTPATVGDKVGRWLFVGLAFLPFLVFAYVLSFFLPIVLFIIAAAILASFYYSLVDYAYRALPGILSSRRRRRARWRKQMSALLSARYGLGPGGLQALMEDDAACARYLQEFLSEHQVPYALPLYDSRGVYQFASPEKVEVLRKALLRAVGKGHDNELFVLLIDLLELTEHLDPLLSAVRVALARHHKVVVICPWPPGLPPPSEGRGALAGSAIDRTGRATRPGYHPSPLAPLLWEATQMRFQRAFHHVRRTFARLGVPVLCAESREPVGLILERLDRLRSLRTRR
jgi:uncharacterized protein (DUF58 family)